MLILDKQKFSHDFRTVLQQTEKIPPFPETARALLKLRDNPDSNMNQLTDLISSDPSLSAFMLKYARMSVFGYGNRINSVHHAISLVLGFNTTLNLAVSIAASGCLNLPNHGILGRIRIWSQTLECAALCRGLHGIMSDKHLINPELIYLSGLFHNFGYLLFGHLYPKEFAHLNDLATHHPQQDVRLIQMQAFGITHDTIGMYLIKTWSLPQEIAITVAEQNFPDYSGNHAPYVKLIALAKRLMHNHGISDGCPYLDTPTLMQHLGIDELEAKKVYEKNCQSKKEFHALAEELAA